MKAAILCNGETPSEALAKRVAAGAVVYCCDGAAEWSVRYGITPDVLLGDMDSIEPALLQRFESAGVRIKRVAAEKDETDSQLAVDMALAEGATEIAILGATGKRIEHTLCNLHLLVRIDKAGARGRIYTDENEIFVCRDEFREPRSELGILSIVPLESGIRIHETEGLYYPVFERDINIDTPYFISNIITGAEARVRLSGGYCAIILSRG